MPAKANGIPGCGAVNRTWRRPLKWINRAKKVAVIMSSFFHLNNPPQVINQSLTQHLNQLILLHKILITICYQSNYLNYMRIYAVNM